MSNSVGNLGSHTSPAFNKTQKQIEKLEARLESERSTSLEEIKEFEEIGRKNQEFLEELKVLEESGTQSAYNFEAKEEVSTQYEDRGMVLRDQVLYGKPERQSKASFKENISYYQKQLSDLLSSLE